MIPSSKTLQTGVGAVTLLSVAKARAILKDPAGPGQVLRKHLVQSPVLI